MHVVDNGLIFDSTGGPADERFSAFAALCPLESGAVIASFQVGSAKHSPDSTIGLCRSRDGGRTWGAIPYKFSPEFRGVPGSFPGTETVEIAPGRLMLITTWFDRSNPSRPLFDPITEGILPTKQLRSFSSDEGNTWTPWEEFSLGDLSACTITGPFLRWRNENFAYAFESYKLYDDPRPHRHAAWLAISSDGGQSFGDPWCVAQDPQHRIYYWDQRLCALAGDGEFLAMFWTHDLQSKCDRTVHLRRGSIHDPAENAADIRATEISGQIAAPAVLGDGRWLAFVVDRSGPCTMKLWVSHDEGHSWPEQESICIYKHDERAKLTQSNDSIDYRQYWDDMLKWTFGHPAIRVLKNGQALRRITADHRKERAFTGHWWTFIEVVTDVNYQWKGDGN